MIPNSCFNSYSLSQGDNKLFRSLLSQQNQSQNQCPSINETERSDATTHVSGEQFTFAQANSIWNYTASK